MSKEDEIVGKVTVRVRLTNNDDLALVRAGFKSQSEVREKEVEGLVDTGATMLVLPQSLVEELGVFVTNREVTVTFADGSRDKRKIGRGVLVAIEGRDALTDCVIEKKGRQVLIGQIPLEEMDLVVDPKLGVLSPRPESPDMPMIEIYGMVIENQDADQRRFSG
ncbi:MAG: aspartyl protease family protein [bacterium]|nr:aspartyl protease family protein [bacterium]